MKTYPMQAYKIMHGLWGMGQMMFTKYIVVVDDDVDVHNTNEVLFRLCANTDPPSPKLGRDKPATRLSAEALAKVEQHLHQRPGRRARPRQQRNHER